MKKPIIIAIVLFVLAVGSISAFFVVKSSQDEKSAATTEKLKSYSLFDFDYSNITSIDLKNENGEYNIVYSAEQSAWKMKNHENYPVSLDYCNSLLTFLSTLTATDDLGTADEAKKADYGLNNGYYVNVSDGVNNYKLNIGSITPTSDNYYVTVEGRDTVYLVDAYYGCVLVANDAMIRNANMVGYTDSELSRIRVVRGGKDVIDVTRNNTDMWESTVKDGVLGKLYVDTTKVSTITNLITRLQAEEFVTFKIENQSDYGFDKPYAELYVYTKDNECTHLLFSYYGENSDMYTHVLDADTGVVGIYYTYDVDFIEGDMSDVLYPTFNEEDIDTVSSIDMKYHDETINFTFDSASSQYTLNGEDVDVLGAEACDYLTNFFNALSYLSFDGIDPEAPEAFEKAADEANYDITIKYNFLDGKSKTIGFIKFEENKYYLVINSEYTGLIIREKDISGTSSFMYWYDMLVSFMEQIKS